MLTYLSRPCAVLLPFHNGSVLVLMLFWLVRGVVACRDVQEGDGDAAAVQARLSMQLAAVQTRLAVRGLGPKVELEVGHMLDSPLELATQLLHRLCMHVPWRGTVCSSMRTRERGLFLCLCVHDVCKCRTLPCL